MAVQWRNCYDKVMSLCNATTYRIQELIRVNFKIKVIYWTQSWTGKINKYLCVDGIKQSVPQDHHLSLLDKPRYAKMVIPGTYLQDYPKLTLMVDSYNPLYLIYCIWLIRRILQFEYYRVATV